MKELTSRRKSEKKGGEGGKAQGSAADSAERPNGTKRRAFVRMKKIFGWLQDGMYPNCSSIARDLEVSVRTAGRDLDCLRDEWDLPIDYDDKKHGFYFTQKVNRLPWVPVTEAELFAVCISSKVLELYQGMPFQKPLELAFAKMTRSLDDEEKYMLENLDMAFSIRPFALEDADVRVLELVTRAVAESRGLKFTYRTAGVKKPERRQVRPYHVLNYQGRMYLFAHDHARGKVRTFVIAKMVDPVITEERFEKPKDFDPKKEVGSGLGVIAGSGDYQVVIEMDPWLTDVLRGRRLHPSQAVDELPGGASRVRLRLSALEEIEERVLGWGTHATVVEPVVLRERIGRTARELAKRYPEEDLTGGNGGNEEGKLKN